MGMQVPHYIAPSSIHGRGLFATSFIPQHTILWCFDSDIDTRLHIPSLSKSQLAVSLHYGYINHLSPEWVVVCGDLARFWNFPAIGSSANSGVSSQFQHGEALIIAACNIEVGEELLIEPASDADYRRKIFGASPQDVNSPLLSLAS